MSFSNIGNNLLSIDFDFYHLEKLLYSLDMSLSEVNREIAESGYSDCEYLFESGEYLIGVGFCAMQRYILSFLQDKEIKPGVARTLGPKSVEGTAIVKLIHAAGNYWKHEPEWHIWLTELQKRSQDTVDIVLHGKNSSYFPLSALLYELCGDKPLQLANCLPYLIEWRSDVIDEFYSN